MDSWVRGFVGAQPAPDSIYHIRAPAAGSSERHGGEIVQLWNCGRHAGCSLRVVGPLIRRLSRAFRVSRCLLWWGRCKTLMSVSVAVAFVLAKFGKTLPNAIVFMNRNREAWSTSSVQSRQMQRFSRDEPRHSCLRLLGAHCSAIGPMPTDCLVLQRRSEAG